MNIIKTSLDGVLIFEPVVHGDERGYFMETWRQNRYEEAGIRETFCQDNLSFSQKGILRGLHFQYRQAQGKLVSVVSGEVFDVAVDVRLGSPTFGRYEAVTLSETNHRQFYVPPGFAHGFCVLSETARFAYKCTDYYCAEFDGGVAWNDPGIGIEWPVDEPSLSQKDAKNPLLRDIPEDKLPRYQEPV